MSSDEQFMVGSFLVIIILVLLNFGGCQYKEYKIERQKLESQAAGQLPPDNVHTYKLDEQQLQRLIDAIKGADHGN